MNKEILLVREMAERCRQLLLTDSAPPDSSMPIPLHKTHLMWMCDQVEKHSDNWPAARLHRWIGFIQCALMANRVLDLEGLKSMFDEVKMAYGDTGEDLFDHLNPDSTFEFDIGGEG